MSVERRSHAAMADAFRRRIWSLETWLETFSTGQKKRPDHNIEEMRDQLHVMQQAYEDYSRAASRSENRQEQQHAQSLATTTAPLPASHERISQMRDENRGYRFGGQGR